VGVLRGGRGPGGKIGLPGGGGTRKVIEYFYRPYIGFLGRKTLVIELNERTKKCVYLIIQYTVVSTDYT